MGKAPFVGEPEALVIRIELHIPDFVYSRIERLDPDVQLQRSVRGIATQAPPVLIESPDAAIAGVHDEPAHSSRGNHYGDLVGARLDLPDAVLVRDPDARVGKRRHRRKRAQEPSRESDRRAHFPPPMRKLRGPSEPLYSVSRPTVLWSRAACQAVRSGRRQRIVSTLSEDISRIFALVLLICGESGIDQPQAS